MNNLLLKKMDKNTTKTEKKVKKTIKNMKVYAILIGVLLVIGMFGIAFYNVSRWYDENKVIFQSPILLKFQPLIKIRRRIVVKLSKTRKEAPIVRKENAYPKGFEEAFDKVWLMESGRGTNKGGLNGYCIAKGMVNEIGYAPHDKYCFESQEEQKNTFITWLTNRINKVKMPWCENIDQCLKIYSNSAYGIEL